MKLPKSQRAREMLEHQDVMTLAAGGHDWPEIAERLDMTVAKVKALFEKGMADIKKEIDDHALAIFRTDVRLCEGAIEALKDRAASGEPIALADMRAMIKLRQDTVTKAREVRAAQLAVPEKGAGTDGDEGPRVKLNFVRLGQARPGHKPEEVDDAS